MSKRKDKPKPPGINAEERRQISIRRKMEFPLGNDEYGRPRLPQGTQDANRAYDLSSGGIVRLRLADPLKAIAGLSPRQRNAGLRFRADYEMVARSGIKPAAMEERVDTSGRGAGIPATMLDAIRAVMTARDTCGHHEIASVVENVCGLRMSIREVAERTGDPRPALAKLLVIGLDRLADAYFGPLKIESRVVSSKKT